MKDKIINYLQIKANKSWKRVILSTVTNYFNLEISRYASSLTYYLIFAIFPCLIFMSSLLIFLDLPNIFANETVMSIIPSDIRNLLESTLSHMQDTFNNTWFTFGLLFSLWFVWRAMSNLLSTLNHIYSHNGYKHKWISIIILSVLLIVFVPIYLIVLLIGQNFFEFVNLFIPVGDNFIKSWVAIKYIPLSFGILLMFSCVYGISSKEKIKKRYILPGALIGTIGWIIFSYCFALYVDKMGRYSVIYGSIGTVIAFLVWLQVSVLSLLMGAVFNKTLYEEFEDIYI